MPKNHPNSSAIDEATQALDIMTEDRRQEALLTADALQRAIFNSANFSSIATDAKGVIQIFNVGAERMLGYLAAEVVNKITPADISDPQELIARARALSAELDSPIEPGFDALVFKASRGIEDIYELTYIRKDGSRFPAMVSVTALRDDQNTIIGYLLIGTDNTARKQIEVKQLKIEALRLSAKEVKDGLLGTIEAVSKVVEARDPYTAGHQRRVSMLATAIAQEMGLDAIQIEGIRIGATIHDIGKIQLPAEILSKPGKISSAELQLMQGHPKSGYEILKDILFPWPVAGIAYQHHERIDGSGYPQGLKGDEICLEARIVAVADVVEAMSSDRPYRPGLGIEVALDEIRLNRGSKFDGAVVDACLTIFKEKKFAF